MQEMVDITSITLIRKVVRFRTSSFTSSMMKILHTQRKQWFSYTFPRDTSRTTWTNNDHSVGLNLGVKSVMGHQVWPMVNMLSKTATNSKGQTRNRSIPVMLITQQWFISSSQCDVSEHRNEKKIYSSKVLLRKIPTRVGGMWIVWGLWRKDGAQKVRIFWGWWHEVSVAQMTSMGFLSLRTTETSKWTEANLKETAWGAARAENFIAGSTLTVL